MGNIELLTSIFDDIDIGVIILDYDLRITAINTTASINLFNCEHPAGCDLSYCYSTLCKKEQVCDDCPFNSAEKMQEKAVKSYVLQDREGHNIYIKARHHDWQGQHIMTLHNVTREVTLVKKIDLNRKEAEAKSILSERRCQKTKEQYDELKNIFDYLPEALVTVNDNFQITQSNNAVIDVLNTYPAGQCYELFGNDSPCPDCPAVDGFTTGQSKKKQLIDGKYYTEVLIKSPKGEGGMLLFREATRQIGLIEEIRDQQNTLSGLVELSDMMQKEEVIETVLQNFLDKLLTVTTTDAAVLLINDLRAGNLWQTAARNIDEQQLAGIARAYLSRDTKISTKGVVADNLFPWDAVTQICLQGARGKKVGLLCIPGSFFDKQQEKLFLFTKSLGSYIDSKLLMRQLEEKANRDQMTGLYNRGYLEGVIAEEQEKLQKYKINYSVAVVDINRLKQANDVYGHEAGDLLITTVADKLQESLRETDIAARVGGDEFCVLLTDTGEQGAQTYISRLRRDFFTNNNITFKDSPPFPVTVSLGVAGTDCHLPTELMKHADRSMYCDKEEFYKSETRYR